jgi:hypothetical protein
VNDSSKLALASVAVVLIVFGSSAAYYGHKNRMIVRMVEHGANPVAARCAVHGVTANELLCAEAIRADSVRRAR